MNPIPKLFRRFCRNQAGGVTLFFVMLIPVLLLVGGIGVDISQLNAQKRQTQSQADLAALAAAQHLPDRTKARAAAIAAIRQNARCPGSNPPSAWGCEGDGEPIFTWYAGADRDVSGLADPATSVDVTVKTQYRPLLLGAVLDEENLHIRKLARGQKFGQEAGTASFRIYNNLLRLNTNRGILNTLLEPLGIAISADVLGAGGLASARVKLEDLLHLASGGVGLEVLGFNDVLKAAIPIEKLVGLALPKNGVTESWVTQTGPAVPGSVTLEEILSMSPTLVGLKAGDILPDIELGLLDLLTATANLKGPQERLDLTQRLGLAAGLKVIDPRIGQVEASLGLIREGISTIAAVGVGPMPHAKLTQADVHLKLSLLSILRIDVTLELVGGEATLVELNCQAREGTQDILASFDVTPYPAALGLSVNLLNENATFDAPKPTNAETIKLLTDMAPRRVSFTRDAYDAYRAGGPELVYQIRGKLDLGGLGDSVKSLIKNIKIGPDLGKETGKCGWNILQCIIDGVGELVGGVLGLVAGILSDVLRLDDLVNHLLAQLGLDLIPVDLVLDSVSCRSENIGAVALVR